MRYFSIPRRKDGRYDWHASITRSKRQRLCTRCHRPLVGQRMHLLQPLPTETLNAVLCGPCVATFHAWLERGTQLGTLRAGGSDGR